MNKSKLSVRQMCLLALFLAIEIIMYLTPIGYLRINALSVTLMHVPVIILASTMGPTDRCFLRIRIWLYFRNWSYNDTWNHKLCLLSIYHSWWNFW